MRGMLFVALLAVAAPSVAAAQDAPAIAEVDSARLTAAKRLIGMMELKTVYDRLFIQLAPTFAQSVIGLMATEADSKAMIDAVVARDPGNRDRMLAILSEEFLVSMQRQYPELLDSAAKEYAAAFTTQELTEIANFYASGSGAKALKLMPQLQASMAKSGEALGRAAGMEAGERAFERIADELLPEEAGAKS